MDEDRTNDIRKLPYPKNKRELQGLLGTLNYFRTLVPSYAITAAPLYELLLEEVKYVWKEQHSPTAGWTQGGRETDTKL